MLNPLRICLDARLDNSAGGIQQVVIGLADAFGRLNDGDEEFLFLAREAESAWLQPYLSGRRKLLPVAQPAAPPAVVSPRRPARWRKWIVEAFPGLVGAYRRRRFIRNLVGPDVSDGTVERAKVDVIHFVHQRAFLTDIPSIYQPLDLQHVHLPHLFPKAVRRYRDVTYRAYSERASVVVSMSEWGKRDLITHLGLPAEKVWVVPFAPVLEAYPDVSPNDRDHLRKVLNLPEAFAYFPAQTWRHKNHVGLFDALALLRNRDGLRVPLVCSGHENAEFPALERRVRRLGLQEQVRFLGFIAPEQVRALYQLCRLVIFPSKFEGWGMPVTDAFQAGAPVACSNVTCLPSVAGDAAILFDPYRTDDIADALRRVWTQPELRRTLAERGSRRVKQFSWDRTARLFRAHYRRLAKRPLSREDVLLLEAPPIA